MLLKQHTNLIPVYGESCILSFAFMFLAEKKSVTPFALIKPFVLVPSIKSSSEHSTQQKFSVEK